MAENKYQFNPETLRYEHSGKSRRKRIISIILTQLAAGLIAAFIIFVIFSYVAETPNQRKLKNENKILAQQYKELQERKKYIDDYMKTLKEQDRQIYKSVFETLPEDETTSDFKEFSAQNMKTLSDSNTLFTQKAVRILKTQNQEYERIIKLIKSKSDKEYKSIPAIQPLYNPDLSIPVYGFGSRIDPFYKSPAFHPGIDYAAPEGTKVFATADGKVSKAGNARALGNRIEINHGNNYSTVYAHLKNLQVRQGQTVKRGDLIAYIGNNDNNGKSLVPHLHYEIRYNGTPTNPVSYFFLDLTPKAYERIRYMAAKAGLSLD